MRIRTSALRYGVLLALFTAGSAFALKPDRVLSEVQGKVIPQQTGFKKLRGILLSDLLETGESLSKSRLGVKGDATTQILRRLNARLAKESGEVKVKRVQTDDMGNLHIRLDQFYKGIPVIGGDMVIHVNPANEVYAVGGALAQSLTLPTSPKMKTADASNLARKGLPVSATLTEKQAPKLVVFNDALAYEIVTRDSGSVPGLWKTYIDAQSGELLNRANQILHSAPVGGAAAPVRGSRLTGEDGSIVTINGWRDSTPLYFLHNVTNHWGVYDQVRGDWSQNATGDWLTTDRAAVSLARNLEITQNYVTTVEHRNSYDNAGAFATGHVHEGTAYVNAYWDGSSFYFGDGDGVDSDPLTPLDVVAHEYGHAITQYTSNLTYSYESGALNESFSDIHGALVEFWAQPDGRSAYPAGTDGHADWLMGEDCWLSGDALRDYRDPQRFLQPSYYLGTHWSTSSGDNGGVHANSGVQNFAFYLLSEGGTGTNDGHAYNITGIGIEHAGAVAMYANQFLLTSTAQYADTREAWVLAATTLGYDAQTVRDVWTACGVLAQVHSLDVSPTSLSFGNVGAGATATLDLVLSNNGAIATTVTNLTFTDPSFSSTATLPLSVPGGSTLHLPIRLTPASLGNISGAVSIASNADDHPLLTVTLSGVGTAPAGISVTPISISRSAVVGDVTTATISLTNTGTADLTVSPHAVENAAGVAPMVSGHRVLALQAGTGFESFEAEIRAFPNVSSLTVWDGTVSVPTLAQLQANDVVVVMSNAYWYSNTSVGNVLADYVDAGGAVIMMDANFHAGGNWALAGRIMTPDYAPIAVTPYTASSASLATLVTHPINVGVTTLTTTIYAQCTSTQGSGLPLGTYTGGYLIGAYNPNKPIVSLNSFPQASYYGGDLAIQVRNALDFVAEGRWLSVAGEGATAIVPQAATLDMVVTLDATRIPGGAYTGSINLTHNVPGVTNPLVIPVSFAVDGFRRLAVNPTTLAFGNVRQGATSRLNLTLTNAGDEATALTGFSLGDGSNYSMVGTLPTILAGGASIVVQVACHPTTLGDLAGTLTISSNAEDNPSLTVNLSATGTLAPTAQLLPAELTYNLAPNSAPADQTATLSNSGGDVLQYHISGIVQTGAPGFTGIAAPTLPVPSIAKIYAPSNYTAKLMPGEVIVALKPGLQNFSNQTALGGLGTREIKELAVAKNPHTGLRSHSGRKLFLVKLKTPEGFSISNAIATLIKDPSVEYAEPNYVRQLLLTPNDPSFSVLWGMNNIGQSGGVADADIDAPEAWDHHTGNKSLVLGLIDTGIDYLHPDLAANVWTNAAEANGLPGVDDDGNGYIDDVHGYDFINNDSDPMDDHFHGTHTAGTIAAAGNNGVGVTGVAWTANVAALKIFDSAGSTTDAAILNAVDYSNAMDMKITSNSWGGGPYSQSLYDLIAEGRDLGHLFVAAAGNAGSNTDSSPNYPSGYDLPNIIAVAATDRSDLLASFSNYGATSVDLGAPGVDVYSCQPGGLYQALSGTSMATPHVAGAAYLVWSYNNLLTAAQVKSIILGNVDPIPSLAGRTLTGGRLNVAKALAAAGPSWLTASPLTPGTVVPGASTPIHVNVNPAGLTAGQWTGAVRVATDDPVHPEVSVAVTANISGCRSLVIDPSVYNFGTRYTGTHAETIIHLRNDCNDVVTVASLTSTDPVFSVSQPLPFTVPAFSTLNLAVAYDPTDLVVSSGTISFETNVDTDPVKTLTLAGTGVLPPIPGVHPTSVASTVALGGSTVVDLEIDNTGGSALNWTMANISQGIVAKALYDSTHFSPMEKGQDDTRVGLPILESHGGPDSFGYRWSDSDDPSGPAFQWTDIRTTGTMLSTVSSCDDCSQAVTLSFPFKLYGTTFNSLYASSNGYITFGAGSSSLSNYPLPSTSMPTNLVAAFFDDLNPSSGGDIYFQDFGDHAVIQFQSVNFYSGAGNVTFQILIKSTGEIFFYYQNLTGNLLSSTTGIQNGSATVGLTVQYNTTYLKNNLAVRLSPQPDWLHLSALSGSVPAGGNQHLNLTLNSTGLASGLYSQVITLNHNAPGVAPINIPVNLSVAPPPPCHSLVLEPTGVDFGTHFLGTHTSGTVNLRNTCNEAVTVTSATPTNAAFSVSGTFPISVAASAVVPVQLDFYPTVASAYIESISFLTNTDTLPVKTLAVTGTGLIPPIPSVNPASVSASVAAGASTVVDLEIDNTGGSALNWTMANVSQGITDKPLYDSTHFSPMEKGQDDTRVGLPVLEAHGGPDTFGYRWTDSDDPGGPAYQWTDIRTTGTILSTVSSCDDCSQSVSLSFPFKLYGTTFTSLYASSNGYITFGLGSSALSNYPLPSTSMPTNLVAAFFDDLNPASGGDVYFQDFGDHAIIQFQSVNYYSGTGSVTFQILLKSTGEIFLYYQNLTGSLLSSTTGIQNGSATVGLTVQYNTAYLKNNFAVRLSPQPDWLHLSALSGSVSAGGNQHLNLTLNSTGLASGMYSQIITLNHNAPGVAPISIPVSLSVAPPAPCHSLVLEPTGVDFGTHLLGTHTSGTVNLRNTCNEAVTVTSATPTNAAFSVSGTFPISVAASAVVPVQLDFYPTVASAYIESISFLTNTDTQPVKTLAVTGIGIAPPVPSVKPSSVNQTVTPGSTSNVDLEIDNTGGSVLNWTMANVSQGIIAKSLYDSTHFSPLEKGQDDTRIGLAVLESRGGPDSFGYRWTDSDDPSGPAYQWTDIRTTGTMLSTVSNCDDCSQAVTLSFPFKLYGTTFNSLYASSNGYITFGAGSSSLSNYPLPSTSMPANVVAALFDDLNPGASGDVYFQDFGDHAIIQYQAVNFYSGTGSVTFQILIKANGEILFYYQNLTGNLLSSTTGIQNGSATVGLTVQYNTAYLKNNLAVRLSPQSDWLHLSALSGSVPAGGSQHLNLTLNSVGLTPGVYSQILTLNHNAPGVAPIAVPVTMTVNGIRGISRILRVGPSALTSAIGARHSLGNVTVGGETRGIAHGSRYSLFLK